jgi:hypothetical protein
MNNDCDRTWTRKFISLQFSKTFVNNELKTHREEVLFQQEIALLPETQPYVEEEIRKENINRQVLILRKKQNDIETQITALRNQLYTGAIRPSLQRREFVRECPDENCRGFLSTAWKCGLCEKWTCPDCHVVKGYERDVDHICNPDLVATAQLLSRDTKPCPKCRTGIFKIDGCNQMWCTQCHTGFNWLTGRIETNVHNPHFFEWQRRNTANGEIPRTQGDLPEHRCENNITNHISQRILTCIRASNGPAQLKKKYEESITTIIRNLIHIREVDIPRYTINHAGNNRALRIQYMRNIISENDFKTLIQRYSKRIDKYTEIRNVYELLINTVTDIIFRILSNLRRTTTFNSDSTIELNTLELSFAPLQEIHTIVEYVNECFREIGKTYSSKYYQYDDNINVLDT